MKSQELLDLYSDYLLSSPDALKKQILIESLKVAWNKLKELKDWAMEKISLYQIFPLRNPCYIIINYLPTQFHIKPTEITFSKNELLKKVMKNIFTFLLFLTFVFKLDIIQLLF